LGGGGWGTNASKPFGVSGVITMKMISNTSKTSISGVTFMFAFWPPLGPTAILINRSPIYDRVLLPARRRRGARRRGKGSGLFLIRQKTELVHAGGAYIVDDFDHPAELRPHIGLEKDPLVGPVRQLILDLLRQVLWLDEIVPEEDLVIASDGNLERVFLVGVVHIRGIIDFGHVHGDAMLQHGSDHHKDDKQYQHHVHHRRHIDVGGDVGPFVSLC